VRERIGNYLLVTAVLALLVVSIASAATAWTAAGHRHHHRGRHRRGPVFMISGNLAGSLRLGAAGAQPLNLWISNRRRRRVIVSDIRVSVSSVRLAAGTPSSCAQSGPNSPNFAVTNLPAAYHVTLPAHATRRLAALGQRREPTVTWLDQPWAQNGCLGSTIRFSYRAKGRYAKRLTRARRHHR
jgi:hypothetical protein